MPRICYSRIIAVVYRVSFLRKYFVGVILLSAGVVTVSISSIFIIQNATAQSFGSGACSYHGGVNCYAGADLDGSVVCNDGWRDSKVWYSDVIECSDTCMKGYMQEYTDTILKCLQERTTTDSRLLQQRNALVNARFNGVYQLNAEQLSYLTQEQLNAVNAHDAAKILTLLSSVVAELQANSRTCDQLTSIKSAFCLDLLPPSDPEQLCKKDYGPYSYFSLGLCYCLPGYVFDSNSVQCSPTEKNRSDVIYQPSQQLNFVEEQIEKQEAIDLMLVTKLKGRILLQVENHGEAWYLDPVSGKRYYMKDGSAAYQMMRSFGGGIADADLNQIPLVNTTEGIINATSICASNSLANRMKGKILLQVQQRGEAWYVYPKNCRRIYMKDGDATYQIMRYLGLGITNADLAKMPSN